MRAHPLTRNQKSNSGQLELRPVLMPLTENHCRNTEEKATKVQVGKRAWTDLQPPSFSAPAIQYFTCMRYRNIFQSVLGGGEKASGYRFLVCTHIFTPEHVFAAVSVFLCLLE